MRAFWMKASRRRVLFRCWIAVLALFGVTWTALHFVPLPGALFEARQSSAEFTDRNGETLREVLVDRTHFTQPARLDEIPPSLVSATIAAEDKRFRGHHGVDPLATVRAIRDLMRRQRVVSGASTITQQLIKISGHRPRTFGAKICEAAQALRLEQLWTKDQILATYLNRLDYGNLRIGCAAASEFYFGKPLADLSLAESAFLAGLPRAPARLNPYVRFDAALARQRVVLSRMLQNGFITDAEHERALAEQLRLSPPRRVFQAPHFVDLLLQQHRVESRASGGIRTTLDLDLTRFIERTLRDRLELLREQQVKNGAVVVIDNRTGDVLALVGSDDYFAPGSGQVNGAWAARSPGSALKPFTYLLALEKGATPASVVADLPAAFTTPDGLYRPENYNRRCYGPVRYRIALANSLNISAVKVLDSIGGARVLEERLQQCGLTTLTKPAAHYGLGLTLGNAETRLLELTNAYACLARLGEFRPYRLLADGAEEPAGRLIRMDRPCDRTAAYLIADMLSDNFARALAFGTHSPLRFDFPVACKTGTSTSFRDNWAVGFTPEFTVGVWVGNFDGSPMRNVSGVTGAGPVLHEVFVHLHQTRGTSWYARPPGVVERMVHPITGKLVARAGAEAVPERFDARRLPPIESPDDYDENGHVRLAADYQEWLASGENRLLGQAVTAGSTGGKPLRLLAPLPGTIYVLDPDLPGSCWLPLKAEGADDLVWQSPTLDCRDLDGGRHALMTEGRHTLTVADPQTGETRETWILVKSL